MSARITREDWQGLYDHLGTMPFAEGSWSNNWRKVASEALALGVVHGGALLAARPERSEGAQPDVRPDFKPGTKLLSRSLIPFRDPTEPFCEGGAEICDTCLDSCGRSEWRCKSEGHEWYGEPGSRSCPRCGATDVSELWEVIGCAEAYFAAETDDEAAMAEREFAATLAQARDSE